MEVSGTIRICTWTTEWEPVSIVSLSSEGDRQGIHLHLITHLQPCSWHSVKVGARMGSAAEPEEKSQLETWKETRPRLFWGWTAAKHSWFKWAAENGGRWSTAGSSPCAQKTMCQRDNSCWLSVFGCSVPGLGSALILWDYWATKWSAVFICKCCNRVTNHIHQSAFTVLFFVFLRRENNFLYI